MVLVLVLILLLVLLILVFLLLILVLLQVLLCLYLMLGVCSLSVLVLYETLLLPVLMYGSETIWKEVRSQIWAVQMDYLRGFLGIRRMDIVPNARIREFCGVRKGLDQCFSKWAMRKFYEAVGASALNGGR